MITKDKDRSRLSRRSFTSMAGVASATLLTGCMGSDSEPQDSTENQETPDNPAEESEDDFPNQDITMVIPYGPGGGFDEYVRNTANYMADELPVDIVAQNVEGAGGRIAMEQAYNADPDGYTTILTNANNFIRQQIIEDVEYDMSDLTYFPQMTEDPAAIGVGTNTDIESFEEYVQAAQDGDLGYYHTGYMGISFMTPYMVGDVSGLYPGDNVRGNDVVYDGRGEGIRGILSGDIHVMAANWSSLLPFAESDDLRILLVCTNEEELPEPVEQVNPDAETLLTAEVDNREQIEDMLSVRRVFAGPPEIPDNRTSTLRDAFNSVLHDDEFLEHMDDIDRPVRYQDSESAASSIETAFDSWSEREDLLLELAGQ